MQLTIVEPFLSGSHRRWAEGYQQFSQQQVHLEGLPGRHWKWRMYGGALTLADRLRAGPLPDLLVATDMCDLALLRASLGPAFANCPIALYFHENQLTYPWSPTDGDPDLQRDRHYAWKNFTSALVADAVYFNSHYHQTSFLEALPDFLGAFPDYRPLEAISEIKAKSSVLPVGIDLQPLQSVTREDRSGQPLRLLWNHRWEYDKQPESFFQLCFRLQQAGRPFELIVLGTASSRQPPIFEEAKRRLASQIIHWGTAHDQVEYAHWLYQSDLLPVTSIQDFFGISVVEAMYCQVYPLLPNRLAYPEHLPREAASLHLYDTEEELYQRLVRLLQQPEQVRSVSCSEWVAHYDWSRQAIRYDRAFETLAGAFKTMG